MPLRTILADELKSNQMTSTTTTSRHEQEIDCDYYSPQQPQYQRSKTLQPQSPQQDECSQVKSYNSKTVQLMNKMQSEFEEKQKRRKMRRTEQLKQQQQQQQALSKSTSELKPTTPKSERKFLTSIINTLFSSGTYDTASSPTTNTISTNQNTGNANTNSSLQKSDAKRLSLRKLKAKHKAKQSPNDPQDAEFNQSDSEVNASGSMRLQISKVASNHSLNIALNYESNEDDVVEYAENIELATSSNSVARFGKIKNENIDNKAPINENNKENLMKQLKAELDEEIKDRRMIELKNNIINQAWVMRMV